MTTGRFAPSPTGDLHLGNLRTALLAWLFARSEGGRFLVRMEDLDRVQSNPALERAQLDDLAALGLDWDGQVVRQSERFDLYEEAISVLAEAGLVYSCYCTRREIREAATAPHHGLLPDGAYPGTCRELTTAQRAALEAAGRPPALRFRSDGVAVSVEDVLLGELAGVVDDVVLRRNDGVPAYNLAVVVDDAAQGVDQVVRGDDLASSTPRQVHLGDRLGLERPEYAHVPMVLGPSGDRLAKRDGAVTIADLGAHGVMSGQVLAILAVSLRLALPGEEVDAHALIKRFSPALLPSVPWILRDEDLTRHLER